MTFKGIHAGGLALTTSGVIGALGTALGWFTHNVTVQGSETCVANPALAGIVTAALVVAGGLVLLVAPSTSDKTNVQAAISTGQVKP